MVSPMLTKVIFLSLIIIATAFEVAGDVFFKKWALGGKNMLAIIGFLIYTTGTIFWAFCLKYDALSKAITTIAILNLIIVVLIGVLYFDEHLSLLNKLGIALGILSVAFMEL